MVKGLSDTRIESSCGLRIDDWAYKKRERYGTILVNLEDRRIHDLLSDRESQTGEKWLQDNPGVQDLLPHHWKALQEIEPML